MGATQGPPALEHTSAVLVTEDGRILMNLETVDLVEAGT